MKTKRISNFLLVSFVILLFIVLTGYQIEKKSCISIPVIRGDGNPDISVLCSKVIEGNGKLFLENIPIKDESFQISSIFSYISLCNFDYEYCKSHDFLISFKNSGIEAKGGSGGAGMFLLLFGEKGKDCTVTGFLTPSGLALPVKEIEKKVKISEGKGFKCILAPNDYENITKFNDIFDLYSLYFNKTLKFELSVPDQYFNLTKKAARYVCEKLKENISYYYQASKCFSERIGENISINKEELREKIKEEIKKIENKKCYTYSCEEIKYQVLKRLKEALDEINNTSYSYWRYKSALGWEEYLNLNYDREKREKLTEFEYEVLSSIFNKYPERKSYFEMKEDVAKYELALTLSYEDKEKILKKVWNLTEKYLSKYGFSITSYNYLQYSKYLYEIDKDINSSLYFAFLALEYSIP